VGALGRDEVVRVGHHSITKAALAHWTAVEAVLSSGESFERPVPKGLVPDPPAYTSCIAYLGRTAPAASTAQLRSECEQKYRAIQDHVLEILINYDWMHEEATARSVRVNAREVDRALRVQLPSAAAFARFLAVTGESVSDARYVVESKLLIAKLQSAASSQPGLTAEQRARAAADFAATVIARWKSRTDCRSGYVLPDCRQYRA